MDAQLARQVLRADAIFDALMGVLLLLARNDTLFERLGLPIAQPEVFTQMLGGLLIGFAVLLWEAPTHPILERHIGRVAGAVNVVGAVLLALWLLTGELDIPARGQVLLWASAAILAAFAAVESRYFHRE